MLIDSHAHSQAQKFILKLMRSLNRAKAAGLQAIVNICTDVESLEKGLELAKKHPWIRNAAATTPHDVEKEGEQVFPIMADHARRGMLVAVGETGLDYYYSHSDRELQKIFLKRYLNLALECQLPVIIHCRDAFKDFFDILDREYMINGQHGPGVLHCFTGTLEEAGQVWDRGWYLSLSGIVTFKNSGQLREVAKAAPLDRLLIETDTPYLAPQSKRGKMNEPSYLVETAKLIAEIKGRSFEEIAKVTNENAKRFFGWNF